MSNLENWEEIISSKYAGQEIPFNEGDWDRAEEMIEKAELKLKRKRWFTIYFLGIASGVLLLLIASELFFTNDHSPKQLVASSPKQNVVTPVSSDNKQPIQPSVSTPGQNNVVVVEQHPLVNSIPVPENSGTENNSGNEKMKQLIAENNNLRSDLEEQKKQNQFLAGKVNELNSSLEDAKQPANHMATSLPVDPKTVAPAQASEEDNGRNNFSAGKKLLLTDLVIKSEKIGANDSQLKTDSSPKPGDSLHLAVYDKPNPVLDLPVPAADTLHHSKNVFCFEAGANYIAGWKYNDTVEGRGLNEVVGFDFIHHFNSRWMMSSALRFERVGYLHVSQKQVIDSTPDFGLNNTSTVISPERLFYFSLPVKLERTFKTKNTIGLGASCSYLFNTTSIVQTINTTDGYQTQIGDAKREYAYFGGLSRMDIAFTLSYRRQLFPKWGLLLEGTYGLRDVKSNSYFTNPHDQSERIMGARFMLTYTLF